MPPLFIELPSTPAAPNCAGRGHTSTRLFAEPAKVTELGRATLRAGCILDEIAGDLSHALLLLQYAAHTKALPAHVKVKITI
jgi:hypothetical protein